MNVPLVLAVSFMVIQVIGKRKFIFTTGNSCLQVTAKHQNMKSATEFLSRYN